MPSSTGTERSQRQSGSSSECVLYTIPGYTCAKHPANIVCKSFNRLFKKCPQQPRVEMVLENGIFVDIQNHNKLSA